MSQHILKAAAACLFFFAVMVAGFLETSKDGFALFLLGYYATLLLNTFFSIKTFSKITPPNGVQLVIDVCLVGVYALLAFSFGSTFSFALASMFLFLLAILKYAHLQRLISTQQTLLRRKVRLNGLAALLSAASAGVGQFDPELAAMVLCIVFAIANVYVLAIRPMYRLEN